MEGKGAGLWVGLAGWGALSPLSPPTPRSHFPEALQQPCGWKHFPDVSVWGAVDAQLGPSTSTNWLEKWAEQQL